MVIVRVSALMALCLAVSPCLATETSESQQVALTKEEAKERMICKSVAPTGTRLAKRTCMTQSKWNALRAEAQDAVVNTQRSSLRDTTQGD